MLKSSQYDFIFLGAGCASLSLLMRMIRSQKFADKKILLIDKEFKTRNDRTWCFWETGNGFFEDIVYRRWSKLDFFGDNYEATIDIAPYAYKMIRGIDFYQYCFSAISKQENIEIAYGEIWPGNTLKKDASIILDGKRIEPGTAIVFNSIPRQYEKRNGIIELLQHFKGWVIETAQPVFDIDKACLMDFRVDQQLGTTFVYILPFSRTRALVEYTYFTKNLLQRNQYDQGLAAYIRDFMGVKDYRVIEEEFGVIPMTNRRFSFYQNGVFHIGAAGGQTKSSSGYTFQFIQKQSQVIVDRLIKGDTLTSVPNTAKRFRFYDNTLLHILYHNKLPGKRIFTELFQKNKPQQVLRFLDNESSLRDELKIISSLPTFPFLKAAIRQL